MKFGSLFSGIGGFDLGFERAGMECAWQCEIDERASAVLARHWPDVKRYTDVKHIGAGNTEPVDLICGGFPCQDVSVAGKRAGLAGNRSGLWFEFHRILSELAPEWVVVENVPGLLSSNGGRDFAVILRGLVELGYGVAWRILDAQYFGVAQRRRRVFIVGHLGSGRAAEILFERESGAGDSAPRRQTGQDLADTIGTSADRVSGKQGGVAPTLFGSGAGTSRPAGVASEPDFCIVQPVARALNTSQQRLDGGIENFIAYQCQGTNVGEMGTLRGGNGGLTGGVPFVTHTLSADGHDASEDGTGRGVPIVFESRYARNGRGAPDTIIPPLKAQSGQSGKGDAAPLVTGFMPRRVNAPALEEMIPTQNAGNGGQAAPGVQGPFGVRRLMPVECERLQGFPDGWTVSGWIHPSAEYIAECARKGQVPEQYVTQAMTDSARYKQLGNAVETHCAEFIGQQIMATIGE